METQVGRNSSLCIDSKATSDKSQQVPVLLGGKPSGRQTGDGKQRQTDFYNRVNTWIDRQHGRSDWISGKGGGQDSWVNYVTL